MIILPIVSKSRIHSLFGRLGEWTFWLSSLSFRGAARAGRVTKRRLYFSNPPRLPPRTSLEKWSAAGAGGKVGGRSSPRNAAAGRTRALSSGRLAARAFRGRPSRAAAKWTPASYRRPGSSGPPSVPGRSLGARPALAGVRTGNKSGDQSTT